MSKQLNVNGKEKKYLLTIVSMDVCGNNGENLEEESSVAIKATSVMERSAILMIRNANG
jgi:hypothetical protein